MVTLKAVVKPIRLGLPKDIDRQKLLIKVGNYLIKSIKKNFKSGGLPNRWKPLTSKRPSYLKEAGILSNSFHILDVTQKTVVVGSIDNERKVKALDRGKVMVASREQMKAVFSNLKRRGDYLKNYQSIAGNRHISIPARPIFTVKIEDFTHLEELYINKLIHIM